MQAAWVANRLFGLLNYKCKEPLASIFKGKMSLSHCDISHEISPQVKFSISSSLSPLKAKEAKISLRKSVRWYKCPLFMRAIQTSTTLSQNDREQEDSLMNSSTSVSTHSTTTHIKKTESMRLKITLSTCSHQTTPKCAIPIRAVFTRFLANSTSSLMTMTTRKDF